MNETLDYFDFRRPQQTRQPGQTGGQGNAAAAGGQRGPKREAAQPAVIPVSKSKSLNICFD